MSIESFIMDNKWIILAYVILAIIIYINRKKFEVESKIFLLHRTKHGVDYINKFADANAAIVRLLGYSAIGVGFVGMVLIVYLCFQGLYNLVFVPSAPATLSLVIPGVQMPGSPIKIPFVYGILSLFVVIVIHEFGHGIVARANGVKIKSTGIGFLGPLPVAFVEPDEKQLSKQPSHIQHSVFAAGPFMNAVLCLTVFLLMLGLHPLIVDMTEPQGFSFAQVQPGYAAEKYNLEPNVLYNSVNGVQMRTNSDIVNFLTCVKPNETLMFSNGEKNLTLITSSYPDNSAKGYLGVLGPRTEYKLKSGKPWYKTVFDFLLLLTNPFANDFSEYRLLDWIFALSLGIGLANLLPLGPVDGGRMLYIAAIDIKGKEKGAKLWSKITLITIAILVILLVVPMVRSIFFKA